MKKVAIIMLLVSLFCIGCSSDSGNNKVTVHKPEINDIEKILDKEVSEAMPMRKLKSMLILLGMMLQFLMLEQ